MEKTANLKLNLPAQGTADWNVPLNENFTILDKGIFNALFPVGGVYIGTMSTCPLQALGIGTWELIAQDRVLQGSSSNHSAGSLIEAGLPDITHTHSTSFYFKDPGLSGGPNNGVGAGGGWFNYNNQSSTSGTNSAVSSIYGRSSTVQPPAYVVNIWRRVS